MGRPSLIGVQINFDAPLAALSAFMRYRNSSAVHFLVEALGRLEFRGSSLRGHSHF